jgi:glucosamine-6-phosphate deaminase
MSQKQSLKTTKVDSLNVQVYDTPSSLGKEACDFVTKRVKHSIKKNGHANLLLATGASQFQFLQALQQVDLDWQKITTFHLDEYVGLSEDHKASFRKYLHDRIIDIVRPGEAYFLRGDAEDIRGEIKRYEQLLKSHPIDVACIGIGENGHLAFNDPPVADFGDPKDVKIVELDKKSRQQQVDEGWFNKIDDVPKQALSLTIPAIMRSKVISCVVPEQRKAEAVYRTLNDPVSSVIPATVLRTHPNATLFLDEGSALKLDMSSQHFF